jgi:hypothetical protein
VQPGHPLIRESSFHVEGVSISGQAVGFTEKGLIIAGTDQPLPDASPVAKILEQHKISVQYLQPINDSDGVISAGLRVTYEQQVPAGPAVSLSYVFGRVVAHATAAGEVGKATALAPGTDVAGPAAAGRVEQPPTASSAASLPSSGISKGPRLGTSGAGARTKTVPAPSVSTNLSTVSASSFYLVLVVAALIALGAVQAVRILAVRLPWAT